VSELCTVLLSAGVSCFGRGSAAADATQNASLRLHANPNPDP